MFDFLVTKDDEPASIVERMPGLRRQLDGLPVTKCRWRPTRRWKVLSSSELFNVHMEFIGCWPVPEPFSTDQGRMFVNPDAVDADRYRDIYAVCECGEHVTSCRLGDNDHADGCDAGARKRARAELRDLRVETFERLARIGWSTPEIAFRFGMSTDGCREFYKRHGEHDVTELQRQYRKEAAETHVYFVTECDMLAERSATVFDRPRSTIEDWARRHFPDAERLDKSECGKRARASAYND